LQFIDLKSQQERIRPEIDRRIQAVLDHGKYIMGPEVGELESRLADFVGSKHAICCASGTDALLMVLMACGVGPGDAVFTSPFTFIATAEVIVLVGATPVFVDIDPDTFNIDPENLNLAIQAVQSKDGGIYPLPGQLDNATTKQLIPRAVMPVDLFGLPADYDRINKIARAHHLVVIEDAAQSFGGECKGKKAGALADIGCTSFFPAKPLGAYGDGGAVFTDNDGKAEILRSIRVHGMGSHKYDNIRLGINGRLDTIQAAILLAKLDIFSQEMDLRQKVAQRYYELLNSSTNEAAGQLKRQGKGPKAKKPNGLTPQVIPDGFLSAYAQYSILAKNDEHRQVLQVRLKNKGVPSMIYYPLPLHLQSAYKELEYKEEDFPVSVDCASRIFSLPMHPYLTYEQQRMICKCLSTANH
jgi:UDP-2-acetamido-2-deoxy-ribo-hexuluronate aminotransferase